MTVQPMYARFDPALVMRDVLRRFADGRVELTRDADYTPDELVTVVQVPEFSALGLPSNRWAYRVRVVLVTTGPDADSVLGELDHLVDSVVSSQTEERGVLVHIVSVDSEPLLTTPHNPSGAETALSSFTLIMRRKEHVDG